MDAFLKLAELPVCAKDVLNRDLWFVGQSDFVLLQLVRVEKDLDASIVRKSLFDELNVAVLMLETLLLVTSLEHKARPFVKLL